MSSRTGVLENKNNFIVKFNTGEIKKYGNPNDDIMKKLWDSIYAIVYRDTSYISCDVYTATPHIICVHKVYNSNQITTIPEEYVTVTSLSANAYDANRSSKQTTLIWSKEIEKIFFKAFEQNLMPAELNNAKWTKQGIKVSIKT